jgi:hypothetical protein
MRSSPPGFSHLLQRVPRTRHLARCLSTRQCARCRCLLFSCYHDIIGELGGFRQSVVCFWRLTCASLGVEG